MAFATREEVLNTPPKFKDVEIGDGKTIRVIKIGLKDQIKFLAGYYIPDGKGALKWNGSGAIGRLLVLACRNEDFTPFFTEADIPTLETTVDPDVVDKLVTAAEELTGVLATQDEQKQLFHQALTQSSSSN